MASRDAACTSGSGDCVLIEAKLDFYLLGRLLCLDEPLGRCGGVARLGQSGLYRRTGFDFLAAGTLLLRVAENS